MKLRFFFVVLSLVVSNAAQANPWCIDQKDFKAFLNSPTESQTTSRVASPRQWSDLAKEIIIDLVGKDTQQTLGQYPSVQIESIKFPNAHANKDNLVTITSGLLERVESTDEFAFVIAHEIGHLLLGHTKLSVPTSMNEYIEREKQADLMAVKLLQSSNFTVASGERLLDRLGKIRIGTDSTTSIDSTHPAIEARLTYLRNYRN